MAIPGGRTGHSNPIPRYSLQQYEQFFRTRNGPPDDDGIMLPVMTTQRVTVPTDLTAGQLLTRLCAGLSPPFDRETEVADVFRLHKVAGPVRLAPIPSPLWPCCACRAQHVVTSDRR